MNGEIPQEAVITALLLIIGAIVWYYYYYIGVVKKRKTDALKEVYDTALAGGNKKEALDAGRAYYSFIRNGLLSIYDEQAIANDMNTMK